MGIDTGNKKKYGTQAAMESILKAAAVSQQPMQDGPASEHVCVLVVLLFSGPFFRSLGLSLVSLCERDCVCLLLFFFY